MRRSALPTRRTIYFAGVPTLKCFFSRTAVRSRNDGVKRYRSEHLPLLFCIVFYTGYQHKQPHVEPELCLLPDPELGAGRQDARSHRLGLRQVRHYPADIIEFTLFTQVWCKRVLGRGEHQTAAEHNDGRTGVVSPKQLQVNLPQPARFPVHETSQFD